MAGQFWSSKDAEPMRNFRFVLHIDGIEQWVIKSVTVPKMTVGEAKHQYINHEFYFPGRVTFNETDVELVNPANPDSAVVLLKKLRQSGYYWPENPNQLMTISKSKSVDSLGQVEIKQLDASGNTILAWQLINCWIKEVDFGGTLKYEDDNLVGLKLKLRYDYAKIANLEEIEAITQGAQQGQAGYNGPSTPPPR